MTLLRVGVCVGVCGCGCGCVCVCVAAVSTLKGFYTSLHSLLDMYRFVKRLALLSLDGYFLISN